MKTITFYSYKGGVGRSLALSNIAIRLSEFKKKVCVLDFDLEAPGLHFKFKNYSKSKPIEKGIVDYIHSFSHDGIIQPKIKDYSITLDPGNNIFKPIELIAAGDIDRQDYWEKLSMINWAEMFYSENSKGVEFFLDLKAKIEKEFKPDFLLIDSRSGITDMSGITLRLMANDVVILAANNDENMYGSKKIIKSLLSDENNLITIPKIHFVLTRLPFTDSPGDRLKESRIIDRKKREFKNELSINDIEINIIHSDRRLEESEELLIGDDYEEKKVSISNDYLNLFDKLTFGSLSDEEIKLFRNKKLAEKEFEKAVFTESLDLKLQHMERAIGLDPNNFEYYREVGNVYVELKNYDEAIKNYNHAFTLNPNNVLILGDLGYIYSKTKNYIEAIKWYDKVLSIWPGNLEAMNNKSIIIGFIGKKNEQLEILNNIIEIDPSFDKAYNSRADTYRNLNKISEAYKDIYKAIELNPNNAIYFCTLAEICSADNKTDEFYLNFNIALSKEIDSQSLNTAKEIYKKHRNEERFINLLNKYGIDINEIFQED